VATAGELPAIEAVGLGKAYLIYAKPEDRLRQALEPRLHRALRPLTRLLGHNLPEREHFARHWALRDLTLHVERGETVGVIGRNGSGKSTLLQLVCGTLTPTEGQVVTRGRVAALLELGSGFNPEYTGRENVFFNASVLGLTHAETEARLQDILAFADIDEFIDQPVKTYSSGMAMRLAFAVIAHVDADLLIIDEALAVGDAAFAQKCVRWLRRFREHGTVLFCGHDLGAVLSMCKRALWLDRGAVRMVGPAKDVCEAYIASVRLETAGGIAAERAVSLPEQARSVPARSIAPAPRPEATAPNADMGSLPQVLSIADWQPDAESYGTRDATVTEVRFLRADGAEIGLLEGGEAVAVTVTARAETELHRPIIGFHVKDRLGQPLFGDNTHLAYRDRNIVVASGGMLQARFVFTLPLLLSGDYAMTAAVAAGTLEEHVMLHWVDDAILFKVRSPLLNGVMVGIPMLEITLTEEHSLASAEVEQDTDC
jgi:lipopolysaccharide transport system ATP-binding protein